MQPAFICDAMLGKLAKALRFFGFDTLYVGELEQAHPSQPLADKEIYELALKMARLVLTKDDQFALREHVILVDGEKLPEQFDSLKKKLHLNLTFDQANSRCYRCNAILKSISKESARGRVREGTYNTIDSFWECPGCKQIFWKGAHFSMKDGILSKFDKIIDQ